MLESLSKLWCCCPVRQARAPYAQTFSVLSSGNSKQSVRELTLSSSAINPPVERPSPMVQWPAMRTPLQRLYEAGLKAADPQDAIRNTLTYRDEGIFLGNRRITKDQVSVLSLGKAGARMAQTCEGILGTSIKQGLVVTKYGHALESKGFHMIEASHPVPDESCVEACDSVVEFLKKLTKEDTLLTFISGGASSLLTKPLSGLELDDLIQVTDLLLGAGIDIEEMNTVRKHLAQATGGRLAVATEAQVHCCVLSDILGNPFSSIASGPFSNDSSTFDDALNILKKHDCYDRAPKGIIQFLIEGSKGKQDESIKKDALRDEVITLLASNEQVLDRIEAVAGKDYDVVRLDPITGEARDEAAQFVTKAKEMARTVKNPTLLLTGGEPVVTFNKDPGKGGRCQEFALAAALLLAGTTQIGVFAASTDGTDGPTDVSGAYVDGDTVDICERKGLSVETHLNDHNATPLLKAIDAAIITGPTGSNVNDIYAALIRPKKA